MIALTSVGVLLVGLSVTAVCLRELALGRRDHRWGTLEAIDPGDPRRFASVRFRLTGRPDALRRRRDGALVPVEQKHRVAPLNGPFASHLVQLWAYCLLVEEAEGRPPPFGVLRYRDREFRIPWDGAARAQLLEIRRAAAAPYDGRANPSPARCRGCRWAPRCDVRAWETRTI
jgi:CRISPR-associated exonuclease Cas4